MHLKKKNLQGNRIAILKTGLPELNLSVVISVSTLIGIDAVSRLWMEDVRVLIRRFFRNSQIVIIRRKFGCLFIFKLNFV